MRKIVLVFVLFLLAKTLGSVPLKNTEKYLWKVGHNQGELIKQPNGPFEVMILDHDAQGCYIGIIYYKIDSNGPVDAIWKYSNCFWQEESWCADINSFAWSIDGKYLYVGTSSIYGNGSLFELDLYNKKARTLFPLESDLKSWKVRDYLMTTIKHIDLIKHTITVEAKNDKESLIKEINIH